MARCDWATSESLIRYHDEEWGVPVHDDRRLFEFLVLEGVQAGLSWQLVLNRREAYRAAFDGFDIERVARYTPRRIERLLANPGIIRNRRKVESAVGNARAVLDVRSRFGSFDAYLWRFVEGRPLRNAWRTWREVPCSSPLSDALSRDLRQHGFTFVGTKICYSFMQAVGMINDHAMNCFRYGQLG